MKSFQLAGRGDYADQKISLFFFKNGAAERGNFQLFIQIPPL